MLFLSLSDVLLCLSLSHVLSALSVLWPVLSSLFVGLRFLSLFFPSFLCWAGPGRAVAWARSGISLWRLIWGPCVNTVMSACQRSSNGVWLSASGTPRKRKRKWLPVCNYSLSSLSASFHSLVSVISSHLSLPLFHPTARVQQCSTPPIIYHWAASHFHDSHWTSQQPFSLVGLFMLSYI